MNTTEHTAHSYKEDVQKYWLKNNQKPIRYGMGCAYIGNHYSDRTQVKKDVQTLETAYNLGMRYFDTAMGYSDSESVLGEWIPSVPRESIFVATKGYVPREKEPKAAAEKFKGYLDASLRKLKVDYIDLYQVHDTGSLDLVLAEGGLLEVLRQARQQGLIRYFGLGLRDFHILEQGVRHAEFETILTYGDYTPYRQSAAPIIQLANQHGKGVINGSPLMFIRECRLDIHNPDILAAGLQFPLGNPGIDINLTGPSSVQEVQSSVQALHRSLDAEFVKVLAKQI